MKREYKLLSYALAFQMEAAVLIIGAWKIGEWLNENYQYGIPWYLITFCVAFLGILRSAVVIIRALLKENRSIK